MLGNEGFPGMSATFGIVQITLFIGLQAHGKLVEMISHLVVVVEAFVKVGFSIAIKILQTHKLVPAGNVNFFIQYLDAQGLKQAGSDPPPGQPPALFGKSGNFPDITICGADDRCIGILHKIYPA